jgi:phage terminase large subunit-like protein
MTRGEEYIQWIENRILVPEGRDVGKPLTLRPFQREIITGIYDAEPRPRYVIISMAKKNAKTALSGALLLLNICGPEAKQNSQLYSTGQTRKQAATIFRLASKMRRSAPDIAAVTFTRDTTKEIVCPELGTEYTALARKAESQHGLSPRFMVHDELGQVRGPTWDLFDALETADQAHDDALSIIISTQPAADGDLMAILMDDAINTSENPDAHPVVSGDGRTLLFLWTADETGHEDDKDWAFTEEAMRQANPAYGDFLSAQSMCDKAAAARRMRSNENTFRNFNLNQRVESIDPFIPRGVWMSCKAEPKIEALDCPLYLGLDLSKRTDLTALAMIAELDGVWHAWVDFWVPSIGLLERASRDRVPYDQWVTDGLITATPGASINYRHPAERLLEICGDHTVASVAFDRWRMDVFTKEIARLIMDEDDLDSEDMEARVLEAVPLRPHGQGFRDMAPALDALEEALLNKRLCHGANSVLTMCAANARAVADSAGNRKLDKTRSTGRIDGLQALAMAFGAAGGITEPKQGPSVYEERGILEVEL